MNNKINTLILGASYGSLLGCKMALAGHDVTLVCTSATAELINTRGTVVKFPIRGLDELVVVSSKSLTGKVSAATPQQIDVTNYDLVVLGMQEPQYKSPDVRTLLSKVATAGIPAMAIMNMPPLPYIRRLPGIDGDSVAACYSDPSVWEKFDPSLVTLASPDPQAYRPEDEGKNVLQVSLPTNFKVARFGSNTNTAMLKQLETDILAARFPTTNGETELPVKVKVHDSLYVPLAKWSMLMTGNYRCVQPDGMIPICDAVHQQQSESRDIYQWTASLCEALGADAKDLVPFEKYANAANGLSQPSSAAKALARGASEIERVDMLVQLLARQMKMENPAIDAIVSNVQWYLDQNSESQLHTGTH